MINHQLEENRSEYKTFDSREVVELYEKIIEDGDVEMISKIAVHPNLPDSLKKKLSNSENMEIRRSIAYDTESEEILRNLAVDTDGEVRLAVALNKATPIESKLKLQNDTN